MSPRSPFEREPRPALWNYEMLKKHLLDSLNTKMALPERTLPRSIELGPLGMKATECLKQAYDDDGTISDHQFVTVLSTPTPDLTGKRFIVGKEPKTFSHQSYYEDLSVLENTIKNGRLLALLGVIYSADLKPDHVAQELSILWNNMRLPSTSAMAIRLLCDSVPTTPPEMHLLVRTDQSVGFPEKDPSKNVDGWRQRIEREKNAYLRLTQQLQRPTPETIEAATHHASATVVEQAIAELNLAHYVGEVGGMVERVK